ncbi:hypothetical protein EXIGLDRAFT_125123 [Exidia glandulosa HHB12029]|uniref:Uncharacterized protein n=1 Tax=Exidia glandulosa HHB12029 TaxID=1314781 RepID=A0A165GCB4_EXIGL|nr:hypothetical protein EXIGLDRAFT_125123 [Exidia glandulosa HHB12029]
MLTIATYGHKLGSSPSSASGFGSVGQGGGRRRAGTISHRESWFMDDDALRAMHPMPGSTTVMDEQPLTDIETSNLSEFDVSSPNSQAATPRYPPMDLPSQISHKQSFQQHQQEQSDAWAQLDLELDRRPSNMSLAASQHQQQQQQQPSRGASRQEVRPQASNASLHVNTVVANNNVSANGSRRSPMSPAQQVAAAASSQRGRSPRTQPPRRGQQKPRSKSQPGLGNTSTASAGTGDEYVEYEMDAIPVWTQPKHNGNWDDVVLPAVAKKMGMVDNVNYEQTDGTPRPPRKRESSDRIAPAPGTFGYDESKVRRPPPTLQLDEFGRPGEPGPQTSGESEEERQQTEPILRPISPGTMRRGRSTAEPPPSPAPFSSYNTPQRPLQPPRMNSQPSIQYQMQPQVYIEPPPPERFVLEKQKEEEKESGCCRCVIM